MNLFINYHIKITFLSIVMMLFCRFNGYTQQEDLNGYSETPLESTIRMEEMELEKGQIISNMLKITNVNGKPYKFYIDLSYPARWRSLTHSDRLYELKPGDSLFIPIRLIPSKNLRGNTKYFINAFIFSEEGDQISDAFFTVGVRKITTWELSINPETRVYFKNNEKMTSFDVNIFNRGNETEEIMIYAETMRAQAVIADSAGNVIKNPKFIFKLNPKKDTTFYFKTGYLEKNRNYKKVDLYNHKPFDTGEERKYAVFVNSTESRSTDSVLFTRGNRVDFVKLANEKTISPYGGAVFPLTIEANINNVLGVVPVMNIIMRGKTQFEGAELIYNSRLNFSTNFYNTELAKNVPWYVGYFKGKYNIQVGNIGTGGYGFGYGGKGIRGEYNFTKDNTLGAFIIRSPKVFIVDPITSMGIYHKFNFKEKLFINTYYSHIADQRSKANGDYLGVRLGGSFLKNHSLTASFTGARNDSYLSATTRNVKFGYRAGAQYSGSFLDNRLTTNLGGNVQTRFYSLQANNQLYDINHRTRFLFKNNSGLTLINTYIDNTFFPIIDSSYSYSNVTFANRLSYSPIVNKKVGTIQPFLFYNVINSKYYLLHYRGLGFTYNKYSLENNFRGALTLYGGYNDILNLPEFKNYFTMNGFVYARYRTVSFNIRYLYGPNGYRQQQILVENGLNPQSVFLSLQHQYLFKNTHFVLLSPINYSYLTINERHSIGVNPNIYLYTNSGWRFNFGAGLNLTSSNTDYNLYNTQASSVNYQAAGGRYTNANLNLTIGIKKDFGIPNPFSKKRNVTVKFIAFYDINGNNIKDENETAIENVVIRADMHEIITNELGEASLINISTGDYPWVVFALSDDMEGWFPLVADSLNIFETTTQYIPYVRGVKITGEVVLDREKFAVDADKAFDLSRIKITALNGHAVTTLTGYNGEFEFYLPFGEYVISMNESILSSRYHLVRNDIDLNIDRAMEGVYLSFYIIEKKRKVSIKKFGKSSAGTDSKPNKGADERANKKKKAGANSGLDDIMTEEENQELKNELEEILSKDVLDKLEKYLTQNITNNKYGNDYDGITDEEWVDIEKLIRKIHNEDGDNVEVPSPLPDAIKLEVDEVNYTQVKDMYERRLQNLDKQLDDLKEQLDDATTEEERVAIQQKINAVQQQRNLINNKLEGANGKLKNIRNQLADYRKSNPSKGANKNKSYPPADFDVRKGFYNENNPIPFDESLPDGLIYRVQLGLYSKYAKPAIFRGMYPLSGRTVSNEKYSYSTGIFHSYNQAIDAKDQIGGLGLKDAFIIAYYNGKQISVSQALRLE